VFVDADWETAAMARITVKRALIILTHRETWETRQYIGNIIDREPVTVIILGHIIVLGFRQIYQTGDTQYVNGYAPGELP
jgi:hypothetical protein